MFRALKYNSIEKKTYGRLNIPFFSIFGRYHEELKEQLGLEFTEEKFKTLKIPESKAKERFSIKVSMKSKSLTKKQLEKVENLECNWPQIKQKIILELKRYYKKVCEGFWDMPKINDAVLYNFFKVLEIEIKQRSLLFYTSSLFDVEHGMIIEITDSEVEVYQPY